MTTPAGPAVAPAHEPGAVRGAAAARRAAARDVGLLAALLALLLAGPWPAEPALAAPTAPGAPAAAWVWPVGDGAPVPVGRRFDPPDQRWLAGHRGVDLVAVPDAPVRAAGAGEVAWAGVLAGRGVVVVSHGALRTTYEPVAADVRVGDVVAAGEPLGRLQAGHAGCSERACLHWGLRRGEQYLDPLALLGAGPVRLLPLSAPADDLARRPAPAPVLPATGRQDGSALPPDEHPERAVQDRLLARSARTAVTGAAWLLAAAALLALLRRSPPRPDPSPAAPSQPAASGWPALVPTTAPPAAARARSPTEVPPQQRRAA